MLTWDILNYLESAETNRRLGEIQEENQWHRELKAQNKLNNSLKYLLQALYRKVNNDISYINLSDVKEIDAQIDANYRRIYNRRKPEKNIFVFIMVFFFSILIVIASSLKASPVVLGILFLFLGYSIYKMFAQRNAISDYENEVEKRRSNMYMIRYNFSYLSSRGVYCKHYLDSRIEDVVSLLEKDNYEKALDARIELYRLFDMTYSGDIDHSLNEINYWNHELMVEFDRITREESRKYLGL